MSVRSIQECDGMGITLILVCCLLVWAAFSYLALQVIARFGAFADDGEDDDI